MNLDRFTDAQDRTWPAPLEEIRKGRKVSHWMWFIFPQLRGLGRSATAQHYGIADLSEARAFLGHPVLGPRLIEISTALLTQTDLTAEEIFGPVDAMKLRSCMTLFDVVRGDDVFGQVLKVFCDGQPCTTTVQMIGEG